jgi:hypothetical protein
MSSMLVEAAALARGTVEHLAASGPLTADATDLLLTSLLAVKMMAEARSAAAAPSEPGAMRVLDMDPTLPAHSIARNSAESIALKCRKCR